MKTETAITGPLTDIKVLDLTAGKFQQFSKWLSQLGATVSHATGKCVCEGSPVSHSSPAPTPVGTAMRHQPNWDTLSEKLQRCDVAIESFDCKRANENDFDFPTLQKRNPGIILVSISGFGKRIDSALPCCDLIAAATGGQMNLSGSPGKPPLKAYGNQTYFCGSLYAVIGVLLALRQRAQSGIGTHIDISLQEVVVSTLEHALVRYFREQRITRRSGTHHWTGAFAILPCKDGYISISPLLSWETLIDLMDADNMAKDLLAPEWHEASYREAHLDHILEVLTTWLKSHTQAWLFETAQLMRLPWAPVQSPAQILACPQLASRRFFTENLAAVGGGCLDGFPFKWYPLSRQAGEVQQPTPLNGRSSVEVFRNTSNSENRAGGILSGVRVLDFSRVLAGPFATRILADFGAEVIKVQSATTSTGAEDNASHQFHAINRNKLGITLNMNRPEAREIALRLVSVSDVVLENFSPRVMNNWGMDFNALQKINKCLIMVRMSAMGQTGPWWNFAAYGSTVQALGGLDFLTAYAPGRPIGIGYAYADIVSGLYGALAVLAALAQRDRTGTGQLIDLSEYEVVCTTIGETLSPSRSGEAEKAFMPGRDESEAAAPYGCYRCRGDDKWCAIAVFTQAQWGALCHVVGGKSLQKHPDFSTLAARKTHAAALDEILERWTGKMWAEDVATLLQGAGVPAGVVQDAGEVARDHKLMRRNFFRTIHHPAFGETFSLASPIRGPEDTHEYRPAPLLGEHNRFVYREILGLDEEEYLKGCRKGIFS